MPAAQPSDEDLERFYAAVPADGRVLHAHMFGMRLVRVGEHYFAGRHKAGVMVRVTEADRDTLLAQGGTLWEPMPGRPRPDLVNLPPAVLQDAAQLAQWVRRAFQHALTLPPKAPKRPKKKLAAAKAVGKTAAASKRSGKPIAKKAASKPVKKSAAKKSASRKPIARKTAKKSVRRKRR
jgi:hypothetical protein